MTISTELEANILRYYHVEKWRIGTIATQLNVHHSVVTRVLLQLEYPRQNGLLKIQLLNHLYHLLLKH